MLPLSLLGTLALLLSLPQSLAVKTHDFKTCSQAGFCRRGRALSARAKEASSWTSPYSVDPASVQISSGEASVTAAVKSTLYPTINFQLEARVHEDGVVRVRMDEKGGLRKRYDEASSWAFISEPVISKGVTWVAGKKDIRATYGEKKELEIVVQYSPLRVSFSRNGKEQVVLNGQGLLHMEHFRDKNAVSSATEEEAPVPEEGTETDEELGIVSDDENAQKVMKVPNVNAWFEGEEEDAYWEETFGSWTDSKPKGMIRISIIKCSSIPDVFVRPRVSFPGHQLPQPRHNLWHSPTRNPTRSPHHHW
jgi:mannosyl-oligosaccharide alpha-1,3-glucosidase